MNRRQFVIAGLTTLATPVVAEAQVAGKAYRLGVLSPGPSPHLHEPLIKAMQQRGWIVGGNFFVEIRYTQGDPQRAHALAKDCAQQRVDLIVTNVTATAIAARRATSVIPIVMATSGYPVEGGSRRALETRARSDVIDNRDVARTIESA